MVISEFSSKTVANVTGVTARQLDYWADTGFIIPSVQAGAGRGKVRLFYWRLNVGDIARQLASDVARLAQVEEVAVRPGDRELPAVIYRDLDSNWWIGRCTTLPGCVTQGKNREEALTLLADAAAEYLAASGGGDAASGTA